MNVTIYELKEKDLVLFSSQVEKEVDEEAVKHYGRDLKKLVKIYNLVSTTPYDIPEPKLIKNWEELSKVPPTSEYKIVVLSGRGVIIKIASGNYVEYLSTHTFCSSTHEYSSRRLRKYGFNVTLASWG